MSYTPTGLPYRLIGLDAQDLVVPSYGGDVAVFTAAAALKVGDLVFLSAANTVNKSNTNADYAACVGVVVGGYSDTYGMVVADDVTNAVGTQTIASGSKVLVQINGIAPVVCDAAVTVGTRVGQGATTAGRVDDIAAGFFAGVALQTGGAEAAKIAILLNPSYVPLP